jgi:hypothetical protein
LKHSRTLKEGLNKLQNLQLENKSKVSKEEEDKQLKNGFIAANNHYARFGPSTANIFGRMLARIAGSDVG